MRKVGFALALLLAVGLFAAVWWGTQRQNALEEAAGRAAMREIAAENAAADAAEAERIAQIPDAGAPMQGASPYNAYPPEYERHAHRPGAVPRYDPPSDTVEVQGYYRKNGTYVHGYSRRR